MSAHLVGLGTQVIDLAEPAIDAIDRGIAAGECDRDGGGAGWRAIYRSDQAMAQWLLTGQNPPVIWAMAFDAERQNHAERGHLPMNSLQRGDYLDHAMPLCLQAGRSAEAIAFYDELAGPPKGGVGSIKMPRHLAYALCQRGLGASPGTDEQLIRAGHRVLREHLAERWLHNGQYLKSAMWLKIVYEVEDSTLSPAQVMLKAYDDMPTVERPDFLPAV